MNNNRNSVKDEEQVQASSNTTKNNKSSNKNRNKNKGNNKNSKPNNNKTNYRDHKSSDSSKREILVKGDRDNDPNWYFENKEVAEQVMNYSFETIVGANPSIGLELVPTVMTLYMNASPGVSYVPSTEGVHNGTADVMPSQLDVGSDGANFMAAKMYTLLSAYSGRNAQYQPNDVLMAILGESSVIEGIESLRRVFGLLYTYNVYNRAVPRKLIEDMGIDFDDLTTHAADYRAELNYQISRINQIPLFGNIGFMRKAVEMYQKVYADEDSPYAQLFQYVPATLWQLDEQTYSTGSVLTTIPWACTSSTATHFTAYSPKTTLDPMSVYIGKLSSMITALLNSTTLNLVYTDLMHLGSKINGVSFLTLDMVSETYSVLPEFDRNALLQMHNMRAVGYQLENRVGTTAVCPITNFTTYWYTPLNDVASDPNTGRIQYNPGFYQIRAQKQAPFIVDFPAPNPSLEDRVEVQRFTSRCNEYHARIAAGYDAYYFNLLADHYCLLYKIGKTTNIKADNSGIEYSDTWVVDDRVNINPSSTNAAVQLASVRGLYDKATNLSKFMSAPMYFVTCTEEGTDVVSTIGNLNYYTIIPYEKLMRMNQIIYGGLFAFRL